MLLLETLNLYFLQSENLELRWRLYRQPVYDLYIYIINVFKTYNQICDTKYLPSLGMKLA